MSESAAHRQEIHRVENDAELFELFWRTTEIHQATSAAYGAQLADAVQAPPVLRATCGVPLELDPTTEPVLPSAGSRVSTRQATRDQIPVATLGRLLGSLASRSDGTRAHPSAGALYAVDTYLIEPDDAPGSGPALPAPGRFRYDPAEHHLEPLDGPSCSTAALTRLLNAPAGYRPAAALVLVGDFARLSVKYGARSLRFLLLEAGAMAQTVSLAAGELGLGSLWLGGTCDRDLAALCARPSDPVLAVVGLTD